MISDLRSDMNMSKNDIGEKLGSNNFSFIEIFFAGVSTVMKNF